jgi:hypothetical protein
MEDRITPSGGLGAVMPIPAAPSGGAVLQHFDSTPVTVTAGSVTISSSPQAQTITLTATATANGAPVPQGVVLLTVTDSSGHPIGNNPTRAVITNGSGSAQFTVPAGLAPGTYTITGVFSDPAGPYSNGTDVPGTLTVNGSTSGSGGSGGSGSSGSGTTAPPTTMFQSWISLYFDGVQLALDQLLQQPTTTAQADANFQMQFAGSFGQFFELAGEMAVFQAMSQHNG